MGFNTFSKNETKQPESSFIEIIPTVKTDQPAGVNFKMRRSRSIQIGNNELSAK